MSDPVRAELNVRYRLALEVHLVATRPQETLTAAYELGREAIESRLGVLDLAELHQGTWEGLLEGLDDREVAEASRRASAFLLESLAPFEMIHRGFRDANARLRKSESRYRELIDNAADLIVIATAISEIARNILSYATRGEVVLRSEERWDGRRGIVVVARDEGPGVEDIDRAMQDGYSTGDGLGLGLPGARRLMDEFEIVSGDTGTTVTMKKWLAA